MDDIPIPSSEEIETMSWIRCNTERTRLRNEVSFARGNSMWGGPSNEAQIVAFNHAIEKIEHRMHDLSGTEPHQSAVN
ncbi:MAG: hypothetical protein IVW54_02070 [Candidatus Binataceae bacterium]|nr:hypothetical protein [Candidatus Binataceae bacterium]